MIITSRFGTATGFLNISFVQLISANFSNVVVDVAVEQGTSTKAVGIDLGCKEVATSSQGEKLLGRNYRALEAKLGLVQRSKNKKRVKAIHAKIVNRRKNGIHKYTNKLVQENAAIFVGNVSSKSLAKTKLAKSVLDGA